MYHTEVGRSANSGVGGMKCNVPGGQPLQLGEGDSNEETREERFGFANDEFRKK